MRIDQATLDKLLTDKVKAKMSQLNITAQIQPKFKADMLFALDYLTVTLLTGIQAATNRKFVLETYYRATQ